MRVSGESSIFNSLAKYGLYGFKSCRFDCKSAYFYGTLLFCVIRRSEMAGGIFFLEFISGNFNKALV